MMSLRAFAKSVARFTLRMAALFMVFFLVYLTWYWWDMRQLRAFCEEARAGTPVSQLPQIAGRYGIDKKWLKGNGVLNKNTNQWSFYVPSTASVGSNVCAIRHDKEAVISAVVEID